jgi:hypothetical protein
MLPINLYPANVENMVNASRWQMGFNLAFKGLNRNKAGNQT